MAILKSEIRNKFTNIPNSIIQENELSDGDFRLLIYLYSLPDGWKINQGYLGQKLGCNRRNINAKLSRIKDAGYLEIIPKKNDKTTDYIYLLKAKRGVSINDVSSSDVSVNDSYINNNIINTKEINNNYNNNINSLNNSSSCFDFFQSNFINATPYEFSVIETLVETYGNGLVLEALKKSLEAGKRNLNYTKGTLKNWKRDGIKILEEIKETSKSKVTKSEDGSFKIN